MTTRRAALAVSALAGVGLAGPVRAQGLPVVKIAYIPYEYSAQVLYARELGLFAKNGFEATLQPIPYSSAIASAVASNAVDIGIGTIMTLASAHAKQIPFTIIAAGAQFDAAAKTTGYLMVGSATGIRTGKDLNGKTVGTPGLATMGEYGVRAWTDLNGGDSSTLKFVEIPFSQMPGAFATGRIDAAFIGEPFLEDAMKVARPLAREMDEFGKLYVITGWFTTTAWARSHPDLVARFEQTMRQTAAWAKSNPARSVEILAAAFKIDAATLKAGGRAAFGDRVTPALIQNQIDMAARYAKFPTFPAEELIFKPA